MTKKELIIGFFEKGYCCDLDEVKDTCLSLLEENQELKKQLEEKENIACNWKDSCLENAGKIEKLENQQKEFIKYLEDEIKRLKENDIYQPLQKMALATHEHILQKYKSIIGVSDEKEN